MKKNVLLIIFFVLTASIQAIHASLKEIKNYEEFNTALQSSEPTIVIYSAQWCGACKGLQQPLQKVIDNPEFQNITFIKIDVDAQEAIAKEQKVSSIPAIHFIQAGTKKHEIIGLPQNAEKTISDALRTVFVAQPSAAEAPAMTPQAMSSEAPSEAPAEVPAPQPQQAPSESSIMSFFTALFNMIMNIFVYIKDMIMYVIGKIQDLFSSR